jgi:hypothetical protein
MTADRATAIAERTAGDDDGAAVAGAQPTRGPCLSRQMRCHGQSDSPDASAR